MFLRNYYNQLFSLFSGLTIANGLKQPDGTVVNSACPSTSDVANGILQAIKGTSGFSATYAHRSFVIGSGTTPASVDDYKLESIITSSISLGGPTKSFDDEGHLVMVMSVTNTGSTAVTIGEIGIPVSCHSASSTRNVCLVERTVLAEPITLAAGESRFITYKFRFAPDVGAFES